MKKFQNNKIVLGLSGGVDSTTAALLLKNKGFEVVGFYFDVLGKNQQGVQEAKKVAEQLDIEFISKDVSKEFGDIVIGDFCNEYINGRTPNPCIVCNPNVKFKQLIEVADSVSADFIATGHYAQIHHDENMDKYYVKMGENVSKDQSYMLYRLGQNVLSRLVFPLGDVADKEETRELARKNNLSNADKKDSQEICFIDEKKDDYVSYIKHQGYQIKTGNFIDPKGKILGQHSGLINYTIGQRKGLGITFGKPVFVTKINSKDNTVTLGENEDLMINDVYSKDNFFTINSSGEFPEEYQGKEIFAKIRYAAKPAAARLYKDKDGFVKTTFVHKQRASTPGQSIVFYQDDLVIGGGFIE
ncbi:MAG: tRNA 2-thiouridine(34) synthase MnmA [Anaerovoracaceae bacterium]